MTWLAGFGTGFAAGPFVVIAWLGFLRSHAAKSDRRAALVRHALPTTADATRHHRTHESENPQVNR